MPELQICQCINPAIKIEIEQGLIPAIKIACQDCEEFWICGLVSQLFQPGGKYYA